MSLTGEHIVAAPPPLSGSPSQEGIQSLNNFTDGGEWWKGGDRFKQDLAFEWMKEQRIYVISLAICYVLAVQLLPRWMHNRPAFVLRGPMLVWNTVMGCYSTLAFIRLLPEFVGALQRRGWVDSFCHNDGYYDGPLGWWVWSFYISKMVELGDTIFLLLKRRPVIFLHWYHHMLVLVNCWCSYVIAGACVRTAIIMNLGVHALMYPYYALQVATGGRVIPRWVAKIITTAQICQFVAGCVVCVIVWTKAVLLGGQCDVDHDAILFHLFMYVSFLVLFVKFFYDTYIRQKSPVVPSVTTEETLDKKIQ